MSCLISSVWHQSTCQERVNSDKMQNEKFLIAAGLQPTALRSKVYHHFVIHYFLVACIYFPFLPIFRRRVRLAYRGRCRSHGRKYKLLLCLSSKHLFRLILTICSRCSHSGNKLPVAKVVIVTVFSPNWKIRIHYFFSSVNRVYKRVNLSFFYIYICI